MVNSGCGSGTFGFHCPNRICAGIKYDHPVSGQESPGHTRAHRAQSDHSDSHLAFQSESVFNQPVSTTAKIRPADEGVEHQPRLLD